MHRISRLILVGFAATVSVLATAQNYPVFEKDKTPPAELKQRRQAFLAKFPAHTIVVMFTNDEKLRNNDVDFLFRGDSNFLYLTGFEEPDAALVMSTDEFKVDGKMTNEVLFCNESNAMSETWLGYRMGSANIPTLLGIDTAQSNAKFKVSIESILSGAAQKQISTAIAPDIGDAHTLGRMVHDFKVAIVANLMTTKDVSSTISNMRGVKSDTEVAFLRKAADESAKGHIEVMKAVKPKMREWEMAAIVEGTYRKGGCEYPGYPSIVGSGMNSCILHYDTVRKEAQDGEIVCMDAAGEYHGYSADVTRTFPVNGTFSPAQKAIYNAVLKAQTVGINACTPGNNFGKISQMISDTLAKELIALGVIANANELGRYYMHGFGHGIGLDVHDPCPFTLVKNALLTVEPGVYIKAGSPCDKKWWNIGVRIEDDILVTDSVPINLSARAPRSVNEIEYLMKNKKLMERGAKTASGTKKSGKR